MCIVFTMSIHRAKRAQLSHDCREVITEKNNGFTARFIYGLLLLTK